MNILGATERSSGRGPRRGRRAGRPAIIGLACLVGLIVCLTGVVAVSDGQVIEPTQGPVLSLGRFTDDLMVTGTGRVSFSAVVTPGGRATTAYFEYGLATRYREPRPPRVVYDESTPVIRLGSDFGLHQVTGSASGLVPNALYHVRLVASSSAGTVDSPDSTFTTAKDPPPPSPQFGASTNVQPVSGLVLIVPRRASSLRAAQPARLIQGPGFEPLTEPRQLMVASQIDARAGTLRLAAVSAHRADSQRVTLAGGLFSVSQSRRRGAPGLTTLALIEGDFTGAPTYRSCPPSTPPRTSGGPTRAGQPSSMVLQTLRAHDQAGRFVTVGHDSSAVAGGPGAVWDTLDRCDGTMTIVQRGRVIVSDPARRSTVTLHAGQRYLAPAS